MFWYSRARGGPWYEFLGSTAAGAVEVTGSKSEIREESGS